MADEETLDLYVVQWPERGIIKVGISGNERWRNFGGGVQLLGTVRAPADRVRVIERIAHERLSEQCARPFRNGKAASHLLGTHGCGYTECYVNDGSAFKTVLRIAQIVINKSTDLQLALDWSEDSDSPLFTATPRPSPEQVPRQFCGHCESCLYYAEYGGTADDKPYCHANDGGSPEGGWACGVCGSPDCTLGHVREDAYREGEIAGTRWVTDKWRGHFSFLTYRCLSSVVDFGDPDFEWVAQR